ncbi:hypothetical protein G6011_05403 [Alternaria panax]|uniref:Uncharacterized protein n=1 Tax=Alternaria panax TaxID=48097 RepID=A0AAD4FCY5_9PLEO|nr:hypothetical protein G6011_05403 [Alternaria panax]
MAETADKDRPLPKKQRPSRLRNQVHPESTDDERDRNKNTVHAPNSETVIPETQPDRDGNYHHDDPGPDNESDSSLSPNSAAFLERTAVKKKTQTIGPIPFFTPLSRALIRPNDSSASASPNLFGLSCLQSRKTPANTSPKEEATAAESSTHTVLTTPNIQKHEAHASQAELAYISPPLPPDNSHHDGSRPTSNQIVGSLDQPVARQPQEEPDYPLPMQANATSDISPSAQPDTKPTSGINIVPGAKKNKKGKKGQLSQQRQGPRPPRPRITPRYAYQAGTIGVPVPNTSTGPRRLYQMITNGHGLHAHHAHEVQGPALIEDQHGHAYAQESQLPNQEHRCITFDKGSYNTTPSLMDTTFQDFLDSSAQRVFPTSSVRVPSTMPLQCDVTEPNQQLLTTVHNQAGSLCPDEQAALSTQAPGESGLYVLSHSHGPVDVPTTSMQPQQPRSYTENDRAAPQPMVTETLLHSVSERDGPPPVTKPRRKLRPSGPIRQGLQLQAMSHSVDQIFENLRVAMLAEKYRAQHESTTTNDQHEAEVAKLQRTIENQIQSIAEHNKSHQNLKKALSQLTDGAKTNQRFVTGLQQDYEKLQKSATNFQKESKRTLTEKITELEDEKRALRQDFEVMTDKLAATQRKLKSTLDEVYVRFIVSESRRKNLAENLSKQEAELKEERKKGDEMHMQLLSGVQSISRQVVDSSDALTKKIELLQTSVDNTTAHDNHNGQIKECLDLLQTLRLTPALTMQDIEKMDSTLRLVHERLDSGLDTLSESVTYKAPPDDALRKFIKEQLHGLQTKILRYEEVAAENRKTHESNVLLKSQLEAQQQHSKRLDEQIKDYRQAEVDTKAWSDQLERDLNELRNVPPVDTSGLEQEALNLRQQLQKAEEAQGVANTKIENIEKEKHTYRGYYEDVKTQLREFEQRPTIEDDTAVRELIAKDCESVFAEKERSFKSEIHQLRIERDEKEKVLQELSNKLDATDTQLDELSEKIQTLESESIEIKNLQEQQRKTTEELHSRDQDYTDLNDLYQEKMEKMSELQGLHVRLQAQSVQQQTTVQTMHRDADAELTKLRQDSSNTLQLSTDQVSSLQEEKTKLSTQLEQVQMNEGELQHEAAELRAAKDADISRIQKEAEERNRKLVQQHRTEVDDWERCMSQKDVAFKEIEAKMRLAQDRQRTKIAKDQEAAESNMRKLEQKHRDSLRVAREQGSVYQQGGSQVQVAKKALAESHETTQAAKPRKKVSRQNHSMLEVSKEHNHRSEKPSSDLHAEVSQTQVEDDDLFATQFEEQGEIDDNSNHTDGVEEEPGTATESQDIGNLSMTQDVFNKDLLRASQRQLKHQVSSPTNLSSISTDELTMMETAQPVLTGIIRGHEHGTSIHSNAPYRFPQTLDDTQRLPPAVSRSYGRDLFNHGTASTDIGVISTADNESVVRSQSSRSSGRPRSRANTASRMMPPPGSNSGYSQQGSKSHVASPKASTGHTTYGIANKMLSSEPSPSRKVYSQNDSRHSAPTGSEHGPLQEVKHDHPEKRKSSIDQTEKDSATKKQRTKSQSRPSNTSSGLPSQPLYVSASRLKAQKTVSYAQGGASTLSQSKAPVPSSRLRGRISHQAPSSGNAYNPHGQSSSQIAASGPIRRSSTRLTRSKSRNGTAFGDGFTERFNEELG